MFVVKSFVTIALLFMANSLLFADYITGIAWTVPQGTAQNAPTLGHTPGPNATEVASFTANGIDFSGQISYTLGGFLNFAGRAGSISYLNGASANTGLNNTEWEFTGSAFFTKGESFDVIHDDGLNMYINGAPVLKAAGPTGPAKSTFTYKGNTGTFNFDFIFVECCLGQANFITTLVPSAPTTSGPEPSAVLLVTGGLLCVLFALRSRVPNAKSSAAK